MRGWWIGAACLAVSAALHAQGSTASASQAAAPAANSSNELPAPAAAVTQPPPPRQIPVGRARHKQRQRRVHPEPSTPSPITDHFALRATYFMGSVATTGQFSSPTMTGTPFSAENTLGLSDKTNQARAELMFRLEQRSRLRMDFMDLQRSGDAVLTAPLQFGDQLFKRGARLQSELDWRQTDFTYTYSVLRYDRFELGVGGAVHLLQAKASAQVPDSPQRVVYSEAGPFVTLAADGTVRIDRHWSLSVRGNYFKLTINNNNGSLADYHADLQYRWRANFALGLGYEYERVDVDLLHANPSGFVQMRINGPELFARLSF